MAIVGGDDELENPNNPNGQQGANSAGGGSYAGGGGSAAATTTKASPDATSSGGYTNLTSYLQANQGSAAATGKAVGNVVDQTGRESNAANATFGANGASEPHGAVADQGLLGSIKAGGATVDQGVMKNIAATGNGTGGPTFSGISADKDMPHAAAYGGPTTATAGAYSGPNDATGVTGYGAAQTAMTKLGDNLGRADGSMEGTSALLTQAYKQPSYSRGENNLDSFLVSGSKNDQGNTATQQATKDWQGQGDSYKALLDQVNGGIGAAKGQTATVQKQYDDAIAGAKGQTGQVQATYDKAVGDYKTGQAAKAAAAAKAQAQYYADLEAKKPAAVAKMNADAQTQAAYGGGFGSSAAGEGAGVDMTHVADPLGGAPKPAPPPPISKQTLNPKIKTHFGGSSFAKFAFGGEIPSADSYSKLMDQLQKKKGK